NSREVRFAGSGQQDGDRLVVVALGAGESQPVRVGRGFPVAASVQETAEARAVLLCDGSPVEPQFGEDIERAIGCDERPGYLGSWIARGESVLGCGGIGFGNPESGRPISVVALCALEFLK